MELQDALTQITEIRAQLARTEVFRGFRSLAVAPSAAIAVLAGAVQSLLIAEPSQQVGHYLLLWLGAAGLSMAFAGVGVFCRLRSSRAAMERPTTLLALEQFAPCLLAGGIVTGALLRFSPESCYLLPGLWPILFSLGVFACYRAIDPAILLVGCIYLLAGMLVLCALPDERAFSPWVMAGTFGIGQALSAVLLYFRLERGGG